MHVRDDGPDQRNTDSNQAAAATERMDDNWFLSETSFDPCRMRSRESLFTIGNGLYCTRGTFEESYPGETPATFASGLYDDIVTYQTELVNLPNWLWLQVWAEDEPFRMDRGKVISYSRRLDLFSGNLARHVIWRSPGSGTLEMQWERWISLSDAHAMGLRLQIKSLDFSGKLEIRCGLDGWVDNTGMRHWDMNAQGSIDDSGGFLHLQTKSTNIEICQAFVMQVHTGNNVILERDDNPWAPGVKAVIHIEPGQSLTIDKLVSLFCSHILQDTGNYSPGFDLDKVTLNHVNDIAHKGYEQLYRETREAWAREWDDCAITIEGDAEIELAIRFNLFQLLVAAPRHISHGSISARGLSGFGYHGHIFWDAELYMLPCLLYTRPELARRMLQYRYHTLPGARANAREKGWQGSMFVWESAATGEETTPRWVPEKNGVELERIWSGDLSIFTTAGVAWAVHQYWQVSGDDPFLRDYGAEIILDTARFWGSRAEWNAEKGRYELNDVIGPDEFHLHVNNNAFTNYLVRWNLQKALETWDWLCNTAPQKADQISASLGLTDAVFKKWREIVEKIAFPIDAHSGLIEQFDGYFDLEQVDLAAYEPRLQSIQVILGLQRSQHLQVTRQPDVLLLLYLFDNLLDQHKILHNWDYYTPRSDLSHGSSLGYSIHAALAAKLGQLDSAYRYLREAARVDFEDTFGNTRNGVHTGNGGGIWQAIVLGFAGLELSNETDYVLHPRLPRHWKRLSFSVYIRGNRHVIDICNPSVDQTYTEGSLLPSVGVTYRDGERLLESVSYDRMHRDVDLLVDSLPGMDYLGMDDPRRTMIEVNTYCYNLTGLHPAELIQNHRYSSLIHPHDRKYVEREFQKARQKQEPFFLIYRMITAAEREKWVWENGRYLSGCESGSHARIQGRIIELTGRNTEFIALSGYAERSESLREIDQAILVANSSDEVIRIALRALRRQSPSVRINLVLLDLEENQAKLSSMLDRSQEITNTNIQVTPEVRRWWYSYGLVSTQARGFIRKDDLELCLDPQIEGFVGKFGEYNYVVRLESQGTLFGILALGSEKSTQLTSSLFGMANEVTNLLAIAITQRRLLEQLHSVNQNLQNLSRRLVDLQEQERRFLARELHDEIGQSLTAIKINLESMANVPTTPDRKRLDDCIQVVSQTLQQVRNISLDLRPALLDELGLPATLRWYMDRLAQWNGIEAQFQEGLRQERLPVEIETTLFRITQEALTNVVRHSGAQRVSVSLNQTSDRIRLLVRDDGCGFHVTEAFQAATMGKSLGLLSIQERLHLIGGRLEIHSIPGMGAEISAEVPYTQ